MFFQGVNYFYFMRKLILSAILTLCFGFASSQSKVDFDKKLKDLGIELFLPSKPMANYVKAVRVGNLLYLSGHGPGKADGTNITGKLAKT